MRREQRLRRRRDFDAAYRQGRSQGNRLLVVRVVPNGGGPARFGFVAAKAVGGAVERNRLKRRLRAIARALRARDGLDIVISARRAAAGAPFGEVERSVKTLMRRLDALDEAPAARESP
ncbi:MAG TPA: ribonuclease P protein component [Dehalococcoidia bacterium]|nr:ribonuclease P protein component [Dehalococcoidia bacterium]